MVAVVVLPGMDGTGELLEDFVRSLSGDLEPLVIAYPPAQALGYPELRALVRAQLPAGPFVLLAESFSGPIAVEIASGASSGLLGLVLAGTFVKAPIRVPRMLANVPFWRLPAKLLSWPMLGSWATPVWERRFADASAKVSPDAWRSRMRAVMSVDVTASLERVSVPTLYIRGRSDRVVPSSAWELISSIRPATRLVELEAPHFILQTRPEASAEVVRAFVAEVAQGR